MRENFHHTGRGLSRREIERADFACRNCCAHDDRKSGVFDPNITRIASLAGHFQPAIQTAD